MLMGKKLRNNFPVLTKNSKIGVSLSENNRRQNKNYFDIGGTRELELLKPGNPVRIRDPIKKRWSETISAEVAPLSNTMLTSSNTIL